GKLTFHACIRSCVVHLINCVLERQQLAWASTTGVHVLATSPSYRPATEVVADRAQRPPARAARQGLTRPHPENGGFVRFTSENAPLRRVGRIFLSYWTQPAPDACAHHSGRCVIVARTRSRTGLILSRQRLRQ